MQSSKVACRGAQDVIRRVDASMLSFLDVYPDSAEATYAMKNDRPEAVPNYWPGFAEGTAVGLTLEKLERDRS